MAARKSLHHLYEQLEISADVTATFILGGAHGGRKIYVSNCYDRIGKVEKVSISAVVDGKTKCCYCNTCYSTI